MIDFSNISSYKENNRIEAKRAMGGFPRSFWETYSSFANTLGGVVLLGVEEHKDHTLQPLYLPHAARLVEELWQGLNNRKIVNKNILKEHHVQILRNEEQQIVIIQIPRASRRDRPIYLGQDPYSGTYRRNGDGDYRCSKEEVENMLRDQSDRSMDCHVLSHLETSCLNSDSLTYYRKQLPPHYPGKNDDPEKFLQSVGACVMDEQGALHPTAGGLLMFGKLAEIRREFPGYLLEYLEYSRNRKSPTYILESGSNDWSGNIFDFYTQVYQRICHTLTLPAPLREEPEPDLLTPLHKAIRDALTNALVHASYESHSGLRVIIRSDRLIFENPGGMRISTTEAVEGGISDPRNMTLLNMFRLIQASEGEGSGIPRIHAIWRQLGLEMPRLEERFQPDKTILYLSLRQKSVNGSSSDIPDIKELKGIPKTSVTHGYYMKIIDYLTYHIDCKTTDIAVLLGIPTARARYCLYELVRGNILVSTGSGHTRRYQLKP